MDIEKYNMLQRNYTKKNIKLNDGFGEWGNVLCCEHALLELAEASRGHHGGVVCGIGKLGNEDVPASRGVEILEGGTKTRVCRYATRHSHGGYAHVFGSTDEVLHKYVYDSALKRGAEVGFVLLYEVWVLL